MFHISVKGGIFIIYLIHKLINCSVKPDLECLPFPCCFYFFPLSPSPSRFFKWSCMYLCVVGAGGGGGGGGLKKFF